MVALTALTKLVVIPGICEVGCLKKFLSTRLRLNGPLFYHFGGNPFTRSQLLSVVEKILKLSKVE